MTQRLVDGKEVEQVIADFMNACVGSSVENEKPRKEHTGRVPSQDRLLFNLLFRAAFFGRTARALGDPEWTCGM